MPLGIFKTTEAYPKALKCTFPYSLLVLWWPPLSHFKEKRVFFLAFPWAFCIFLKLPVTSLKLKIGAASRQSPVYALSKHYFTSPAALESVFGATVAWQGLKSACWVMYSCIASLKRQYAKIGPSHGQALLLGSILNLLDSFTRWS